MSTPVLLQAAAATEASLGTPGKGGGGRSTGGTESKIWRVVTSATLLETSALLVVTRS